jgi:DNA-binding transcriptional LysR family regulator
MNEHLRGIDVFVATVESGSFTAAGERLHLSRSAVGKAIARLEARLGAQLFRRTTRSQRLSDEGAAYYERCVRALSELEAGEALFAGSRDEPAGRLRLSVPVLFGRRCIAPLLVGLAERYPRLQLDVMFSDHRIDLIDSGVDLAVRSGELGDSAGLVARRLGRQCMMLCAAPSYLARHGTPATVAELARHASIAYLSGGRAVSWQLARPDGRYDEFSPAGRLRFDDLEAIMAAVVAGAGIAWLPRWLLAGDLREGRVLPVLADTVGYGFDLSVIWPLARYLPARTRVVVDALSAQLGPMLSPEAPDSASCQ